MKLGRYQDDERVLREMGVRVERARKAAAWTQVELARRAGISKRTLERMENGQVAVHVTVLFRVAAVLGWVGVLEEWVPTGETSTPPPSARRPTGSRLKTAQARPKSSPPDWPAPLPTSLL
jgi:transcriptional regulator with XRE-family HTH domain